jgi:hypothetical protein
MKFLSDVLAKAGLVVDGVVTFNNTATGQTPAANDNSTKLATTAWVRGFVTPYSLPIASGVTLGGVKVGSGLAIDGTGVLSVSASGVGAIRALQQITATTGQTVFTVSGGYTPGLIDVFLNGVLLTPTAITATNGTTFTLADAAVVNDLLDIFVYNPIYNGFITSTDQVPEGSVNLYFTNTRARAAISLTVTGSSGASTYSSSTGVLNVPTYTLNGLGGVPTSRTLTINGVTYDLTADRTWSVGTVNTLTTTGTSGPATLVGNTLNIPQYTDQFVGTVTSVGLSMPPAFTVSNSPVTSAGTLTVVGAGNATQYVRGDGALATLPTSGTGGGSSVSFYLNGSVNQGTIGGVTYYEMNRTPIIGTGTDFSRNSNGYIASFLTDAGDPALLAIPGGNWNFETYFNASSGGGSPRFYIELYKYDGTTFTLIASNSGSPKLINDGTSIEAYFSALAVPQTTLTLTDRLAIRIYVNTSGRTITLHTENGHLSQIITTFTTGLTALNGLTAQVQYFQIGTSGTDFNISSATATHTFNLPTASAVNRGALSAADWAVFNGKQNAITLTTTGTSGPATYNNTTGVLNIPEYQGGVTSFNTRTGAVTLSSGDVTTALTYTPVTNARTLTINGTTFDLSADRSWSIAAGVTSFNTRTGAISLTSLDVTDALTYTPVTNARTLTINGEAYDLTADRTWTVGVNPSARTIQTYTATASQTTFTVTGGYIVGLVDVFINGVRLTSADFTATNGTTVVLTTGTGVNNIVDVIKYTSAFTASSALRQVTYFTATAGQTTFTVSYTPGLVDVFYNGSKLASSEYTASNGTTVVLTNAAVLNDTLEIIAYAYSVGAFTGQAQLNGTGFVKVSGTTVTYDNSTYLTTSSASSTYQTILTNPVTGTGTSGTIPVFTGSTTIGNSIIQSNSTQVNIVGYGSQLLFDSLDQTKSGGIQYTNNFELLINNSRGTGSSINLGNSALDFNTNVSGNPRLRITEGGNIGINTTTPATTLEVNGVGLFTGASLAGNTKNGVYIFDSVITSLAGGSARALQIQALTLSFFTGATYTEKLKVFENGNVVISTSPTDAGFKLDVNGTGRFSGNLGIGVGPLTRLHLQDSAPNYILLTNTAADGVTNAIQGGIIGQSRGYGNNLAQMASILFRNDPTTWFKGVITFSTNPTDGTDPSIAPTERMRITSGGNVGIGTANPLDNLVVSNAGANALHFDVTFSGGASTIYSYNRSTNVYTNLRLQGSSLTFLAGANAAMTVTSGSNVLIGTTTDNGGRLQVDGGSFRFNWSNPASSNYLWINRNSTQDGGFLLTKDNVLDWQINNTSSSGDLIFYSYGISNPALTLRRVNGAAVFTSTVTANNLITGIQGLNVAGYGFYTQTVSGQMTIIGHNISASSSVANQVYVVNGGWYSSMIKMYYSDGITFHTSSTVYSASAVYPMDATERVRIKLNGEVIFYNSVILRNGQINSLTSSDSGQSMYLNFQGNGTVYAGSSYAVLYAGSDERIKTEINHSQSTLSKILNLIPRTFRYKERPELTYYGFIAQEVEKVMPELVRVSEGITMCVGEEIENQKSVESYGLVWASILVKAIQELKAELDELKSKN